MQKKNPYIYYFIDEYNINELAKLGKNIHLVFRNYKKKPDINIIKSIQHYCKNSKRKFYLSNNIKLAIKLKLDGVYIPSFNKKINFVTSYSYPKNFEIIGSAHNINEIRIKKLQKCSKIFISPIFKTKKYKKSLSILRFNLMTKLQKFQFIALGGINKQNLKKIKLTSAVGFAGISWIKKNGLRKLRPF